MHHIPQLFGACLIIFILGCWVGLSYTYDMEIDPTWKDQITYVIAIFAFSLMISASLYGIGYGLKLIFS